MTVLDLLEILPNIKI